MLWLYIDAPAAFFATFLLFFGWIHLLRVEEKKKINQNKTKQKSVILQNKKYISINFLIISFLAKEISTNPRKNFHLFLEVLDISIGFLFR
jgi:hypothetical protein